MKERKNKNEQSKKILAIMASVMLIMGLGMTVNVASLGNDYKEIYYTVYNEKNEVVEEGIIPRNTNSRYHWSPNITLSNGWYTSFRMSGTDAFYVTSNTTMKFSYTLNRSAKISYQFMKSSQKSSVSASTWKSGTITAKSSSVSKTADATAYYYVGVTNASSDPITITSVDFTF